MSSGYPPCPYTLLYLEGDKGLFLHLKAWMEQRALMTINIKSCLLMFKVLEALKIGDGPLTMVMGQQIGLSDNTA